MQRNETVMHYTGQVGTVENLYTNAIRFQSSTGALFTGPFDEFKTLDELQKLLES